MRSPPVAASKPLTSEQIAVSRTEWYWLGGAMLLGVILRFGFLGRVAVEHFDEGVYASNFWFELEQGGEYPARYLYAPPLLPMAIEWTMIIASLCGIKPVGFIPMIPSLIAGIATIPSMWYVGRRWFGPVAGIVAAWLVAASDFHASYSRAALTDVPVCLFMLWAVYFIWSALQTGTRRDILLAGLFTSLAWWTKYNGWLPLAIGLSGGTAWQLSLSLNQRNLRQFVTRFTLMALTAFALWSPVLWGLQKHGGYATVAANHRGYMTGASRWPENSLRLLEFAGRYDNWFGTFVEFIESRRIHANYLAMAEELENQQTLEPVTIVTLPESMRGLGLLGGAAATRSFWQKSERTVVVLSWIATPLVFFLTTIVAGISNILRDRRSPRGLAVWLLGAWVLGLSLATPCYHTYPRLILPWLIANWIGVGLAVESFYRRSVSLAELPQQIGRHLQGTHIVSLIAGWLVMCSLIRSLLGTSHAWQDRSRLQADATKVASSLREAARAEGYPENEVIVYVYADPALLFSLKSNGLPLVSPTQSPEVAIQSHPRPTFLAVRRYRECDADSQLLQKLLDEGKLAHHLAISSRASHLYVFDQVRFEDVYGGMSPESYFNPYIRIDRVKN